MDDDTRLARITHVEHVARLALETIDSVSRSADELATRFPADRDWLEAVVEIVAVSAANHVAEATR